MNQATNTSLGKQQLRTGTDNIRAGLDKFKKPN